MRISVLLFAIMVFVFAVGCSTIEKSDCSKVDWTVIGGVDGENGRSSDFVEKHIEACEGAAIVNRNAYLQGREEGLVRYCTRENGYKAGKLGVVNPASCSAEQREEFEVGYRLGRKVYLIDQERDRLQDEIKQVRARIEENENDKSVLKDITRFVSALVGSNPTAHLEERSADLGRERIELESQAPLRQFSFSEEARSIELAKNTGGAMVGMVVGFGLGHLVQGRYATSGWLWTLGESAMVGLAVASSSPNCASASETSRAGVRGDCATSLPVMALLGWLGLRVWQTADIYQYAYQRSLGYPNFTHMGSKATSRTNAQSATLNSPIQMREEPALGSIDLTLMGDRPVVRWTKTW